MKARDIIVARTGWEEVVALKVSVVEFVHHEGLKTVADRVDVTDPLGPTQHVARRNGKTSVHDETQDEDGGGCQSLDKGARASGNRTEEHGHDERQCEGNQDEEEEVSGFSSKVRHEIQDQVEGDGIDNLVRHIGQHTSKEEKSGARVETGSGRWEVVEDGRDDEGHDGVGDELGDGDTGICLQANETSPQAKLDLLDV